MPKKIKEVTEDTWREVENLFVYGEEKKGLLRYPNRTELSKRFDIPIGTLHSRATKGNWVAKRDAHKNQIHDAAIANLERIRENPQEEPDYEDDPEVARIVRRREVTYTTLLDQTMSGYDIIIADMLQNLRDKRIISDVRAGIMALDKRMQLAKEKYKKEVHPTTEAGANVTIINVMELTANDRSEVLRRLSNLRGRNRIQTAIPEHSTDE